jgi:hypothetical protein
MPHADPMSGEDVALLREAAGAGLAPRPRRDLASLADRLDAALGGPGTDHSAAVRGALTRRDVEVVRRAASEVEGAGRGLTERLDALALKLAAYLPPKNGG